MKAEEAGVVTRLAIRGTTQRPATGLALLLAVPAAALGQLPVAQLHTVFPPGGQAGQTVEVDLGGADLAVSGKLHFSHPGITAEAVTTPADEFSPGHPVPNKFRVKIAPDVPPGVYGVRVSGRNGISNPRAFVVGDRPEVVVAGANHSPGAATAIALDTTVNGRTEGEQYDHYRFRLAAGQRVVVDGWADRIDSRADLTFALFDAAGRELARDRDTNGLDPLLDFTAPAEGDYTLQVADATYRGGAEYGYRFAVSTRPHIDAVFPPAGVAGTTQKFVLTGRNLPGGQPLDGISASPRDPRIETVEVEVALPAADATGGLPVAPSSFFAARPGSAVLDGFSYRWDSPRGPSNPVTIFFATAPVVLETEPNDRPEQPQVIAPPVEVGGSFLARGDVDRFDFEAKKGAAYWIEVFGERLGSPLDPVLLVQRIDVDAEGKTKVAGDVKEEDDNGENVGGRRVPTNTRDPVFAFTADRDGRYRITVRDHFNGGGPGTAYRLSVREARPDFRLVAIPDRVLGEDNKQLSLYSPLARGGSVAQLEVAALRRDGFKGEVALAVSGLPDGVTAHVDPVRAGKNNSQLLIVAPEGAPAWAGGISITGTAQVGDRTLTRQAIGGAQLWRVGDYDQEPVYARLTRDVVAAVSPDPEPLLALPAEEKIWEAAVAGKLTIPLKIGRHFDPKGEYKVSPTGIPGMAKVPEVKLKKESKDPALTIDLAKKDKNDFKPGEYVFALRTEGVLHHRDDPAGAAAAEEERKRLEGIANGLAEAVKKANAEVAEAKKAVEQARTAAAQAGATDGAAADAAKEAESKLAATEKRAAETAARAQAATRAKDAAAARAQQAAERAKQRDRKFAAHSPPIRLKIHPAPVRLAVEGGAATVKKGATAEVAVQLERLFGFAEAVEIEFVPGEVKGLTAPKATVAKDQSAGKLTISAAADAPEGEHSVKVRAKLKYNGQDLTAETGIKIRVEP